MDDRRVGRAFRAVRRHQRLRQVDVAARAGTSQRTVSEIELGRLEHVGLDVVRAVGAVLDIRVGLDVWWRSGRIDRLLDRDHAQLVEWMVRQLRDRGWEVRVEYTFSEFGERGSADILAWHASRRALAIVEVKSRIDDIQETVATFGRKVRLLPRIVERDLGWQPIAVGRILVIADTTTTRRLIEHHRATFEVVWPGRSAGVDAWVRDPMGDLGGIRFVRVPRPGHTVRGSAVIRDVIPRSPR